MLQNLNDKRVLVTGAGGWLGGEIAARLVAEGAVVTALVRRQVPVLGNDGHEVPVARILMGDISAPLLGWDAAAWRAEAREHDLVVHCAALTKFNAAPELAYAVNVAGTGAVVDLVAEGGAGLLHISTAYVNGTHDGSIREGTPLGDESNNAYEETKAAGEALVRASGVPAVIARPSIVLGDYETGRVRTFGTFYYLLKLLAEGRITHMPAEPWATLNLVPIDYVVDGVIALLRAFDSAVGRTFHLVADDPTPMSAFAQTLKHFPGLAVPHFVAPASFEPPPGRTFGRLIAPYAPYFSRNPRFDDRDFLSLTGMACPPIGSAWWERLVSFAVEAGFITQASRIVPNGMVSEAAMPSSAGSR